MSVDVIGNSSGWWRVALYWWFTLADYSHHIAPSVTSACRHWRSSDEDGLNGDQARELAAELQRSIDDGRIDEYARQLFVRLYNGKRMRCLVEYEDDSSDAPFPVCRPDERRFVNEFIGEVQRFIEFLLSCEGFRIQ
ncbi:hypothetical protein [Bradyrhizobium sp. sBnM-33]|uniref:hypothetical protein n=1 Tax=Bradyrhizobium sp. sBnM-33 TaxID=2831780 RepID=UPI001BCF23FA|nr:hypothetical protein [Bradyrhizobium sp. sBnM-33]WOH51923.1 hypothetical protein RX328_06535 [Bradyrhizobium sp. sBnM-33]